MHNPDPKARQRIVDAIRKLGGTASARQLADATGHDKNAIRSMLYTLQDAGVLEKLQVAKTIGRLADGTRPPRFVWRLTGAELPKITENHAKAPVHAAVNSHAHVALDAAMGCPVNVSAMLDLPRRVVRVD